MGTLPLPLKSQKAGILGGSLERGDQFGGLREDASSLLPSLPTPGSVPVDTTSGLRQALFQGGHAVVAGCFLTRLQPHGLPAKPVGPCQLNQDTLIGSHHLRLDRVGADATEQLEQLLWPAGAQGSGGQPGQQWHAASEGLHAQEPELLQIGPDALVVRGQGQHCLV